MANAYKVIQDVTIPKAVSRIEGEDLNGNPRFQTEGILYTEGSYVAEDAIVPTLREKIAEGEFEAFLEPVSKDEMDEVLAEMARAGQFSTFVPEHEVERITLHNYGHDVVSRKDALALNSAGADVAKQVLEAAKEDGGTDRPQLVEQPTFAEVNNLATASREGTTAGAEDQPEYAAEVDVESESHQTMPSGVVGGAVKADAEQATVEVALTDAPKAEPKRTPRRKKPGAEADGGGAQPPKENE